MLVQTHKDSSPPPLLLAGSLLQVLSIHHAGMDDFLIRTRPPSFTAIANHAVVLAFATPRSTSSKFGSTPFTLTQPGSLPAR